MAAGIEHLGPGQMPPRGDGWIMVERQESGTCMVHIWMTGIGGKEASFRHDGPFRHLADALDVAHRSAVRMGHETIFVKGLAPATTAPPDS
jgi:hypothetical protein